MSEANLKVYAISPRVNPKVYISIPILCLLLSGCASFPFLKSVSIPVTVPCVENVPIKPDSLFDQTTGSIYDQVKSLLIDREKSKEYEGQLEAVVEGCK